MNSEIEELERNEILDQTIVEDQRSDLKQHADKMLRDFEKFNDFSSNRAIWELVQNACDLTNNAEILIDYRDNRIAFSHNGKPFTTMSLISLVKQVSGKYGDQEDVTEVGKYGTGFLTTHTFGRKFFINSFLESKGYFFPIEDFLIDRSPKEWIELSDNIAIQKGKVYNLIKSGKNVSNPAVTTTFKYLPETPKEFDYIKKSSSDLEEYIPYVFTINERLNKVQIITETGEITNFNRVSREHVDNEMGINLYKTTIGTSKGEKFVYSIVEDDYEIEIIIPINNDNEVYEISPRIAKLFLYYPLVGSEEFGINFIINSKQFMPNEPRSGIHLQSNKDQVKEQEEQNRQIIEKCTNLIFEFLNSNIVKVTNPLLYTHVNFKIDSDDSNLNEYFRELQATWNQSIKELPFVKTKSGYITVSNALFLDENLLVENEAILDIIYNLASKFYESLPVREDVILWSKYAKDWKDDDIEFITHLDILEKISELRLSDFEVKDLISYYKHLIEVGETAVFSDLALLPNINGNFSKLSSLLKAKDLNDGLLNLGRELIPLSIEKLIDERFLYNFNLIDFNRRNFSDEVKLRFDDRDLNDAIYTSQNMSFEAYHSDLLNGRQKIDSNYFKALLDYCKLSNNINSTSKPAQILKIISTYFGFDKELISLPNVDLEIENIENRAVRKGLVQIFFNLISLHTKEWVEVNLSLLAEICSLYDDSYKEAYKEAKIYPDQIFELHSIDNIKRDKGIYEDIKEIYFKVTKKNINEKLSIRDFNEFIPEEQYLNNKYLTTIVEEIFAESELTNIESHPFKDVILSIIPKLTTKEYQDLFDKLDAKKANIMISFVTNDERKDDIFAIVCLEENKLKKLGQLVKRKNFETILNLAEQIYEDELHKKSNFEHKYKIGTYIEDKIRNSVSEQLKSQISIDSLETINEQGGQDIVIRLNNEPIYFIEVKSRWDIKNSVSMSKLQLERATLNVENYSLCSVDVTNYTGEADKFMLPIEEIIPLVKFVNNIGVSVKLLIENNLFAETRIDEDIHLVDYRGIVPQNIIKQGNDFDDFISELIKKINYYAIPN